MVSVNISKRKLMCTEMRMLRDGFNSDKVMKGNNCSWKLLFFCFSSSGIKLLKNVHLQLPTMLTRGGNKEFDDLQFLHLFCDFSASQMWSEVILQIEKVQNSASPFYSFVINDQKIKEFSMFVNISLFKIQKLFVINMLTLHAYMSQ